MGLYTIEVLEYAQVSECPVSSFVYGQHNAGTRKMPYGYVLIRGNGIVAMIDVGYNEREKNAELARFFQVSGWNSPKDILGEVGVSPEDVTHVIITHGHFDHMGNIDAFPNAKFFIQERELTKLVWSMSLDPKFQWLMIGLDPADIMRLVDLAQQGRLVSLNGDTEDVLPGIDCHLAEDSHTWGSQWVCVRNDGQRESEDAYVLAGDLVYSYQNLVGMQPEVSPQYMPVGLALGSQYHLLLAIDAMVKAVGGDTRKVIPVHEYRLPEYFPSRLNRFGQNIIDITGSALVENIAAE